MKRLHIHERGKEDEKQYDMESQEKEDDEGEKMR